MKIVEGRGAKSNSNVEKGCDSSRARALRRSRHDCHKRLSIGSAGNTRRTVAYVLRSAIVLERVIRILGSVSFL